MIQITETEYDSNERTQGAVLSESQARLAGIVDSAMDAIVSVDDTYRVCLFNCAAEALFGLSAAEAIGQPLSILISQRFRSAHKIDIAEFAATGETSRRMGTLGVFSARRADGEERLVQASISQVHSGNGTVYTAILRDVTERAQTEETLFANEEQLRRRNAQLALLSRVSQDLIFHNRTEEEMLNAAFAEVAEAIGAEMYFNYQPYDDVSMRLCHWSGLTDDERTLFDTMRYGEFLCGRVAARRKPIIVEDIAHSEVEGSEAVRSAGFGAYAGFPFLVGQRLLGTIAFITRTKTHFAPGEVQMIQTACDQVAAMLERTRLSRELAASEERQQLGAKVAGLALAEVDYSTGLNHLSAEAAHLYGLGETTQVVPRADVHATFHVDDAAQVMSRITACLDPTGPGWFNMDHRVVWPDGQVRWLRVRKQVFFEGHGQERRPRRAMLAALDVTAEKEAADHIMRSATFVRNTLDSLPALVVVLDGHGTVIMANEAWNRYAEISGGDPRTVAAGANYFEVCRRAALANSPEAEAALTALEDVRSGRATERSLEYPCAMANGVRWFLMQVRDLADGGPGLVVTHTDITERKQAEAALRDSEERFRMLAELSPDALLVHIDGRYVYANAAAACLLAVDKPEEIIGRSVPEIIPSEHLPIVRARIQEMLGENRAVPLLEYHWRRLDGALVDVEVAAAPIHWQGKRAIQVIARDITNRKRAELLLLEADRRKDEFLVTLAHELRNPLAPIRSGLQVLQLGGLEPAKNQNLLATMDRQMNHLVRLVDDLLEVSRIACGKIELKKERIDLRTILSQAVDVSRPWIIAGRHTIDVVSPSKPLWVEADPVRITQVLANLLNNAAKYTEPGGRIELSAQQVEGEAVLKVRDSGIGIPSSQLDRVFDLFSQVDRHSNHAQGGLGIGLTLVQKLVDMHGGRVCAYSEGEHRGSEFAVYLPLNNTLAETVPLPANLAARRAKRRILIVDDNEDAADSQAMLLNVLGAEVQAVYSGPQALEALVSFRPDLILLDLGMPGMDGYETARQIQQHPEGRSVPLVALSGWGQEADRLRTKEMGFFGHLVKPVDLDALKKLIADPCL